MRPGVFGTDKSESAILASALAETGGVGSHASPGSTTAAGRIESPLRITGLP